MDQSYVDNLEQEIAGGIPETELELRKTISTYIGSIYLLYILYTKTTKVLYQNKDNKRRMYHIISHTHATIAMYS